MSTYEIIGLVFGSITIFALIWGGIWGLGKLLFKLGEYKGKIDASKEEADNKIEKLSVNLTTFSKEVNLKLDNISERLSKVEGKINK